MAEASEHLQTLDFHDEIRALMEAASGWGSEIGLAWAQAFPPASGWLLSLVLMVVVGLVGERLACWKLNTLNQAIHNQRSEHVGIVLGYAVFRILFDLAGVMLFGMFAWLSLYFTVDSAAPVHASLQALLMGIVTFRACVVIARAILAPHSGGIRPLALDNRDAQVIYRWAAVFIGIYTTFSVLGETVISGIQTPVLARSSVPLIGLVLNITLNVFVWTNRERIGRLFASPRARDESSILLQLFAQSWPYMVTTWLLLLWGNWAYAIFINDSVREQSTMISWWVTLLFPAVDRLINAGLHKVAGLEFLRNTGFEKRRVRFVALVQSCVRVILLVVALVALGVTWNIAGTDILNSQWGQRVVWSAVDIGITLLIAYVLYEIVMSLLDKHMPQESEGVEEIEGEIGGAGATRQETLAPLLRTVFIALLVVVVVLSAMSSLGVQILPLLAGASILGLAIGFGAQKLVQDIISGVFFLIDDAFRRGEYIDLGTVKGTVEKISVRSMQLRHHNGALHTIPFGEIRHLTNYSRDWVMMKLKLRLTYDTDVERVRKLIKKLGAELLEDEEIGALFLQPLKSQGVYSMEDDSAMIMRVKFMTRPGDQFVVRKTVYAKIRDLFAREGIEFAHRVVSVRVDSGDGTELSERDKKRVAGAALSAGES